MARRTQETPALESEELRLSINYYVLSIIMYSEANDKYFQFVYGALCPAQNDHALIEMTKENNLCRTVQSQLRGSKLDGRWQQWQSQ